MMAPEDAFRLLADGLGKAGTPLAFDHLVERISSIFDGEHVLIGKLLSDNATIRTVAFWSQGSLQPAAISPSRQRCGSTWLDASVRFLTPGV